MCGGFNIILHCSLRKKFIFEIPYKICEFYFTIFAVNHKNGPSSQEKIQDCFYCFMTT